MKSLDNDSLKEYYLNLECSLKYNNYYNIHGLDLFSELKIFKKIIQVEDNSPMDILNHIRRLDSFPNAYILLQ